MVKRLPSILVGAIVLLTASSSFSEELVKGGILTCTPIQLDRKPIVYLFNEEHLVKDDKEYWLLDSLGTIGGRYLIYGGLTPSDELIQRIKNYHDYIALLSAQEVAHEDIYNYLQLINRTCRIIQPRPLQQYSFREQAKQDNEIVVDRVPSLPIVSCDNVNQLYNGGKLLIPEAPQVGENDLNVSKVIIDTSNWSIVAETFFKSRESLLSLGEKNAWQQFNWPFGVSLSACQVIELDTVKIETDNRLIENQAVPL